MVNANKQPTAASGDVSLSIEDKKRLAHEAKAKQERQRQGLNLQRENILSQRTSNPIRRTALEAALKQIDGQLAALN
ncbi:MAG: hypothetical protein P4L03_03315 [Terracidiphilus sp.]|nr:hypothetical protein [Terracidiphilus sp.]